MSKHLSPFSSLLRHDAVDTECLIAIATKLAAFHARVPSDKAAFYGSPQTIAANLRENFRATRPFVDHTITGPSFKAIKAYSEAFQKEHPRSSPGEWLKAASAKATAICARNISA